MPERQTIAVETNPNEMRSLWHELTNSGFYSYTDQDHTDGLPIFENTDKIPDSFRPTNGVRSFGSFLHLLTFLHARIGLLKTDNRFADNLNDSTDEVPGGMFNMTGIGRSSDPENQTLFNGNAGIITDPDSTNDLLSNSQTRRDIHGNVVNDRGSASKEGVLNDEIEQIIGRTGAFNIDLSPLHTALRAVMTPELNNVDRTPEEEQDMKNFVLGELREVMPRIADGDVDLHSAIDKIVIQMLWRGLVPGQDLGNLTEISKLMERAIQGEALRIVVRGLPIVGGLVKVHDRFKPQHKKDIEKVNEHFNGMVDAYHATWEEGGSVDWSPNGTIKELPRFVHKLFSALDKMTNEELGLPVDANKASRDARIKEVVADNLKVTFIAGHETTSHVLVGAVASMLRDEVDAVGNVVGQPLNWIRQGSTEDVENPRSRRGKKTTDRKMRIASLLHAALEKYSPTPVLTRQAVEDLLVPIYMHNSQRRKVQVGWNRFKKGQNIFFSLRAGMHADRSVGDRSMNIYEVYNRAAAGINEGGAVFVHSPSMSDAFSKGPRTCIGATRSLDTMTMFMECFDEVMAEEGYELGIANLSEIIDERSGLFKTIIGPTVTARFEEEIFLQRRQQAA